MSLVTLPAVSCMPQAPQHTHTSAFISQPQLCNCSAFSYATPVCTAGTLLPQFQEELLSSLRHLDVLPLHLTDYRKGAVKALAEFDANQVLTQRWSTELVRWQRAAFAVLQNSCGISDGHTMTWMKDADKGNLLAADGTLRVWDYMVVAEAASRFNQPTICLCHSSTL